MTLLAVFQLVEAGRIEASSGHLWVCPVCGRGIGKAADADHRDRLALDHCLSHGARASGGAEPRAAGTGPPLVRARYRKSSEARLTGTPVQVLEKGRLRILSLDSSRGAFEVRHAAPSSPWNR